PSVEMLEAARARLQAVEISAPPWQALDLPLQRLPERGQRHDLVICHAVLEWLADPAAALADLRALVRPGGALSLAFYNRGAPRDNNSHKGSFRQLQRNQLAGMGRRGLTPQQPLDPRQVQQWIAEAAFDCRYMSGVRVFHDYMPEPFKSEADEQQVIEQELLYSTHPAYLHLGRYLHCWLRPKD